MARYDLAGRRVWLTGGGSGIGAALACALAARGCRLALTGRTPEALRETAKACGEERCLLLPGDVADPDTATRVAAELARAWGGVDLVILNAGICEYVDVAEFRAAPFERQLAVNLMGVVHGIEAMLPLLRASPAPCLVAVSSQAALAGLSRAEAYGASKAALRNLLDALRIDLHRERLPVLAVYPGFVRTPLTDRNDFGMPFLISADEAADRVVAGIERLRPEIRFPAGLDWLLRAYAALPVRLRTALGARMVRP